MSTSELPIGLIRFVAFVFGTLWGSFFNVCIYRWPRDMSVIAPPSHCPACGASVPGYRNIPVLGYLLLRGRASCCGAKLTPRYVVVELLGGLLCLACFEQFFVRGEVREASFAAAEALLYFAFTGGLLVATFVDLEWMEIPDEVSLPGAALGLASLGLRSAPSPEDAALGAGIGYLVVQVLFVWVYEAALGRRGMGEGDSKLLLFIGAFLGWQGVLFALVGGAVQGLVATGVALLTGRSLTPTRPDGLDPHTGLPLVAPPPPDDPEGDVVLADVTNERDAAVADGAQQAADEDDEEEDEGAGRLKIPFGPFLALAALEFLFFGDEIAARYESLFAI